ncbi:unnamed protein product [Lathyrus sativus]|nr:unnamed protein product [Lathyrus sativus]
MREGRIGDSQNETACSSRSLTEETAGTLSSMPLRNSIHAPPHLPFDLVAEILCRLSVKLLIQLRCVSKSWNSLISQDSKFAKKHLRLSTSSDDRHHLILSSSQSVLYHSPISSIFSSGLGSSLTTSVKQFSHCIREILNENAYCNGVSTCDGMVCFMASDCSVVLCNPSIRKYKRLPPLKLPNQLFALHTLVYDPFTNNYKIIAVSTTDRKTEVNVHTVGTTVGTDYWRRIQDFPNPLVASPVPGIFVSDSVYWLAYDYDSVNWLTLDSSSCSWFIVSLDLEKESYQKLSFPVNDVQFTTSFMTLGTLKGSLSLISLRDNFYDVWVMKEYGNEKFWNKLLSVPHMKECGVYGSARALYISKNDQVLMEFIKNGKFNLAVYDFINNTFKIQDNPHDEMMAQEVYAESLKSPL